MGGPLGRSRGLSFLETEALQGASLPTRQPRQQSPAGVHAPAALGGLRADPPFPSSGALCPGWGFSTRPPSPRPPGPCLTPAYPGPRSRDSTGRSRAQPSERVPETRGVPPPPSHGRHQREAGSSGPADPQQAKCSHSPAWGPTAGDFPSHQDFRRTPLLRALRLLRSQGLGWSSWGPGGGLAGWLDSVARDARTPRSQSPHDLPAIGPGASEPVPWAPGPRAPAGRKGHRSCRGPECNGDENPPLSHQPHLLDRGGGPGPPRGLC